MVSLARQRPRRDNRMMDMNKAKVMRMVNVGGEMLPDVGTYDKDADEVMGDRVGEMPKEHEDVRETSRTYEDGPYSDSGYVGQSGSRGAAPRKDKDESGQWIVVYDYEVDEWVRVYRPKSPSVPWYGTTIDKNSTSEFLDQSDDTHVSSTR